MATRISMFVEKVSELGPVAGGYHVLDFKEGKAHVEVYFVKEAQRELVSIISKWIDEERRTATEGGA